MMPALPATGGASQPIGSHGFHQTLTQLIDSSRRVRNPELDGVWGWFTRSSVCPGCCPKPSTEDPPARLWLGEWAHAGLSRYLVPDAAAPGSCLALLFGVGQAIRGGQGQGQPTWKQESGRVKHMEEGDRQARSGERSSAKQQGWPGPEERGVLLLLSLSQRKELPGVGVGGEQ